MNREERWNLAETIDNKFRENHIYAEVFVDWDNNIRYQIDWGDWKHEHLRADWIAREFLEGLGITAFRITEYTTEEDGSDTYSAEHKIEFIGC